MKNTKKYDEISLQMFNKKYDCLSTNESTVVRLERLSRKYKDIISLQMFNKKHDLLSDVEKNMVKIDIDQRKSYIRNSTIKMIDGVAKLISSNPKPKRHAHN